MSDDIKLGGNNEEAKRMMAKIYEKPPKLSEEGEKLLSVLTNGGLSPQVVALRARMAAQEARIRELEAKRETIFREIVAILSADALQIAKTFGTESGKPAGMARAVELVKEYERKRAQADNSAEPPRE